MVRITRFPAHACLVAATLLVLLPVTDAFAQRSRGSVRSTNRSAGTRSTGTRSRATTDRTVSGNTSTRNTTAETRRGETVTGSRTVTKGDDSLTVNRELQSSSGASVSKEKQVEFDDGRVESVERDVSATDRYGRTAQYSGKAEREGYGWEFEGEGKNRFGQNVEVDGYGARGYYGSGVVADVEGGRYGNRTVVAGRPYGGRAYVSQLPYGSRPYNYWGRPYYGHGGIYYRPYPIHGVVVYGYIPPPYWVYYPAPPVGAIVVTVAAATLLYSEGTYYQKTTTGGSTQYQVVPAPAGATIPAAALPPDRATITISGQKYFLFGNTFYKNVAAGSTASYIAVTRPVGVVTVKALPPDVDAVSVGSLTYFKTPQTPPRYYLTYLDPSGEESYVVVDAPPAPTQLPAQASAPGAPAQAAAAPAPVAPARLDLTLAGRHRHSGVADRRPQLGNCQERAAFRGLPRHGSAGRRAPGRGQGDARVRPRHRRQGRHRHRRRAGAGAAAHRHRDRRLRVRDGDDRHPADGRRQGPGEEDRGRRTARRRNRRDRRRRGRGGDRRCRRSRGRHGGGRGLGWQPGGGGVRIATRLLAGQAADPDHSPVRAGDEVARGDE